jgi:hypothetical protein
LCPSNLLSSFPAHTLATPPLMYDMVKYTFNLTVDVRGHLSVSSPLLLPPCSYVYSQHLCTLPRDHT